MGRRRRSCGEEEEVMWQGGGERSAVGGTVSSVVMHIKLECVLIARRLEEANRVGPAVHWPIVHEELGTGADVDTRGAVQARIYSPGEYSTQTDKGCRDISEYSVK